MTLSVLAGSTAFGATVSYATDCLERMGHILDVGKILEDVASPDTMLIMDFRKRPVRVDISGGKVSHIGYSIFTDRQRGDMPYSAVFNFLERYALNADLPGKRVKTVSAMLAEDNITCSDTGFERLRSMGADTTLAISVAELDERMYRVEWRNSSTTVFYICFPIDYDLLHGTSMSENERRLVADLQTCAKEYDAVMPSPVRKQLLPIYRRNYYILPGESYLLDNLTTNLYYRIESSDSTYVPICSGAYPFESIANILVTGAIDNNFEVDMKIDGYNPLPRITAPLNAMLGYFRRHGCTAYFGIGDYADPEATCYLIFRNRREGYCHLMRIIADVSMLDRREGTMTGRLTPYIPMSRVTSLFDD